MAWRMRVKRFEKIKRDDVTFVRLHSVCKGNQIKINKGQVKCPNHHV